MLDMFRGAALATTLALGLAGATQAATVVVTYDFTGGGNQEGYALTYPSSPAGVGLTVTGYLYTAPETINAQAKVYQQSSNGLGVCGTVLYPSTTGCSADKQLDGGSGANDNELLKFSFDKVVSLVSVEFNQNDQNDIFDFFIGDPLDLQFSTNTPVPPNRIYTFGTPQQVSIFGLGIRGDSDEVRIAKLTVSYETAVVPLPAGLPLMLAGLGALVVLRRRKAV